jgi:hypothetical protein
MNAELDELAEQLLVIAKTGMDNGEVIPFKERLAAFKELREHEKWRKIDEKDQPTGGIHEFKKAINGADSIGDGNTSDKISGNKRARNDLEALSSGKSKTASASGKSFGHPSAIPNDNAVYSDSLGSLKPAVSFTGRSVRPGTDSN